MSDTFITIIAIFLAAILMFIFPLMTLADRNDDITQLTVQTATTEFIDEIRRTGKLTEDHYNNFQATLASTGNAYDVELEFQILDENPEKKSAQTSTTRVSSWTGQTSRRCAHRVTRTNTKARTSGGAWTSTGG